MELPDLTTWREGLVSFAAAAAGRLLLLPGAVKQGFSVLGAVRTLVWEVPFTAAVALLGWAVCESLSVPEPSRIVAIALLARWGPDRLEAIMERMVPALRAPEKKR